MGVAGTPANICNAAIADRKPLMYTHADTFPGIPGDSIQDHTPQLGGKWTAVNATPPTSILIDSRGGCSTLTNANNDFQQANPLNSPSFRLACSFITYASSSTSLFGLIAAPSSAYASFVFLNYQPASSTFELATLGHSVTHIQNVNDGLQHTMAISVEQDSIGNPVAYLYIDEVAITNITLAVPTGTLYPFLRMSAGAGGSTPSQILEVWASDNNQPPLNAVGFLCPAIGAFAQWTPATASSLAALIIEMPPRSIVLKGIWATNAVPWFLTNTPPELQFQG